jgi:hypothetical protein
MKKGILVGVIILLIALIAPSPILAFNPQPEPPAKVKKIDSISNVLEEINQRLERVPSRISLAPSGLANELESIAKHLQLQGEKLGAVLPVLMEPGDD